MSVKAIRWKGWGLNSQKSKMSLTTRASLVYKIIVGFSRDLYEMILVGKFQSREIGENAQFAVR